MQSEQTNEDTRVLSVMETARRLGLCRRSLEREVASKKFPPPAKVRGKSVYFVSDVVQYLARIKAQRDANFSPS